MMLLGRKNEKWRMEIEPELFFLHFGNNRPVYRILTVPVQVYGSTEGNSMVK